MPVADDLDTANLPGNAFIELRDEQVSAQELMLEVRRRMAAREAEADMPTILFPDYSAATAPPGLPEDVSYSFSLYYHLQRAYELFAEADTMPVLEPSPATRTPILGRLWLRVRRQAHELILFYVNRHVAHVTATDRHLVAALGELTRQMEEQQRTIARLESRLSALEKEDQAE